MHTKEQYYFDVATCPVRSLKYWRPWLYGRQHFGYQWCSISVSNYTKGTPLIYERNALREVSCQWMGKFLLKSSITLFLFYGNRHFAVNFEVPGLSGVWMEHVQQFATFYYQSRNQPSLYYNRTSVEKISNGDNADFVQVFSEILILYKFSSWKFGLSLESKDLMRNIYWLILLLSLACPLPCSTLASSLTPAPYHPCPALSHPLPPDSLVIVT